MAAPRFGRKALFAALLVSIVLVVSTSLVAAEPLMNHSHPAGSAASAPPAWGHNQTRYAVSFVGSGLPAGTNWSVQLVSDTARWGFYGENSTNATIGFVVPNGTYNFTIANTSNSSTIFTATPSSGEISVNGSAVSVAVSFSPELLHDVLFVETGLPSGTFWSVELSHDSNGSAGGWGGSWSPFCFGTTYWNGSINASIAFEVPNGTYNFSVSNATNGSALYVPTPMDGNLTVNGSAVTVDVVFATVPLYNVTLDETGLPATGSNGTFWFAAIWNDSTGYEFNYTSNSSISFEVPNGTYNFTVGNASANGSLYVPSPMSGNFTVAGANVTLGVSFARLALFNLTFAETGLPNGTFWSVALWNDSTGYFSNVSSSSTISFEVPNGTYNFSVQALHFYPWGGEFSPNCQNGSGAQYVATPSSGNVTIDGAGATVDVTFAPIPIETVTFSETGLPNGTYWWVVVSNNSGEGNWSAASGASPAWGGESYFNASCGSNVSFVLPAGTYNFLIGNVSGNGTLFVPTPMSGNFTLGSSDLVVNVTFSPVALYHLSFVESGLPNGTFWYAAIWGSASGGLFNGSWNGTVSFEVPNGTYYFAVGGAYATPFGGAAAPFCGNGSGNGSGSPAYYTPSPANGTVIVDGANVTVEITFAKLTFYTVSFVETGLPNGTFWWVDLGGAPFFPAASSASGASPEWGHGGNGSGFNFTTIQFELPNGTYDFSVGNFSVNDSLFVPSPANGTVSVNGANVTISIVFTDPPLAGHLSSQGLRPAAPALKLPAGPWLGAGIAALALLGAGIVLAGRNRGSARPPVSATPSLSAAPPSPPAPVPNDSRP